MDSTQATLSPNDQAQRRYPSLTLIVLPFILTNIIVVFASIAVMHVDPIGAFLFGAMMCLIYLYTGSIRASKVSATCHRLMRRAKVHN